MKKLCIFTVLMGLIFTLLVIPTKDDEVHIELPPVETEVVSEPEKSTIHFEVELIELVEDEVEEVPEVIEPIETKTSLGTFVLTAYCSCPQCCNEYALNRPLDENGNQIVYTASGAVAQQGVTIAVDPTVLPYGTKVEIDGHTYIAHDTGGAINGNRIDVYFADHNEAWNFGKQEAEVFLVKE
jgi:3D (Asp-Asp-Asp) domain-containing protein